MSEQVSKSILITGANGGLGIAIAEAFLEENTGNHVFLGVKTNREKAEAFCAAHPGRSTLVSLDVTDPGCAPEPPSASGSLAHRMGEGWGEGQVPGEVLGDSRDLRTGMSALRLEQTPPNSNLPHCTHEPPSASGSLSHPMGEGWGEGQVHGEVPGESEGLRTGMSALQSEQVHGERSSSWKAAVEFILAKTNRLDVLVNNAGFHADGLLATLPATAWHSVIQTNLDGVFHGCQAVLPAMISQRFGRIINVSSLSALLAPAGQANYAAAKAGVLALTQSLAKEVARIGITVNAICPGYIDTEALSSMDPDSRKAAAARIPMRRFGKPSEVAAGVRFLACAEAGYITGSTIKIDGGIF